MSIVLALPKLFDDVVERFNDEGTNVPNLFGWRASAQQLTTGKRIVWIPGDVRGQLGQLGPARSPGRNPRPLATLAELFTVEIVCADATQPENERAQYQATRELYDAWWRACHLAAHGTVRVLSNEWVTSAKERRYGAAIRVLCAIDAMVPDEPLEVAPLDTSLVLSLSELDVDEDVGVEPA